MTIYTQIDTGTVDDDGSGDTLRAAFDKVNANYDLQDVAITLDEVASSADPGSAKGRIWVRDDAPTVLIFTDDTGAETVLGAGAEAIDDLTDVDTTTAAPNVGEHLSWDGNNWIPGVAGGGGGAFTENSDNSIFSEGAGASLTTGTFNFFALDGAGALLTNGDDNICIGQNAGAGIESVSDNIFIGINAGLVCTDDNNVIVGSQSGNRIGDATQNTIIGPQCGQSITTGDGNTVIGYNNLGDGSVSTTGGFNTAVGQNNMQDITSGASNVAVGQGSFRLLSTGSRNIVLGLVGLDLMRSGDDNISIGSYASSRHTLGSSRNITIGNNAGPSGYTEEDDQLYISNAIGDPLIGGDFSTGIVRLSGAIRLTERATRILTPAATFGELWIRSDGPNVLIFTDDAGTDTVLGGGGGSALEVEDDGVSLSTAVTKFNFTGGFTVTEPVDDEIEISIGPTTAASEYCPGYAYNFINTTQFSILGFNVTNLLSVSRRLKFVDGLTLTFGLISASVFGGGNTTVTMSMDGAVALTNTITEFCLVTGSTAWSPIAGDPFGGTSINSIVAGAVGATIYWVIVGDGGKIASSIDGGVTWVVATSGTAENLHQVDYNPDSETFICIGDTRVINRSTDGLTWVVNLTSIFDILTSGNGDVLGIDYSPKLGQNEWILLFQSTDAGIVASAFSTNDGLAWSLGDASAQGTSSSVRDAGQQTYRNVSGELGSLHANGEDTYAFSSAQDVTSGAIINTSLQSVTTAITSDAYDGTARVLIGKANGVIWVLNLVSDDVTFGSSGIRGFAFSLTHSRIVCVAEDGKIGYISETDLGAATQDAWTLASNNSDPTANFNEVHWNSTDGVFIAVNDVGQILRSSNGIGDPIVPVTHTGFTLIAGDPMAGTAINDIAVGTIGGTVYWVICGSGGQIFTSTDAGVNWVSRASGLTANLVTIGFDAAGEQFMVGGGAGEFTTTTDGTTWTGNTADIPAITGLGSSNIIQAVFDDTAGLWWLLYAGAVAANVTITAAPADLTTWTIRDTSVITSHGSSFAFYNNDNGSRIYVDEIEDVHVYNGATNTLNAVVITDTNTAIVSAGHAKSGTNGNAMDFIIGTEDGDLSMAFTSIRAAHFAAMSGPVRGIAFTTVNSRYIAVGDGNDIRTLAAADTETRNRWEEVINPFTANITAIAYNATNDIIIAVGSNGEIGRSVDGIS